MHADRTDPQGASDTPSPASPRQKLVLKVRKAMKRGDWALIERLAETRNLGRARAVGHRLATALPAEEARLDAWLDGSKAATAIFAFARQAADSDAFFALVTRICRTQPSVVERLMPKRWASAAPACIRHLRPLLEEFADVRPYPSRAARALLAGCEASVGPELLRFLAEIYPGRDAKMRAFVAGIAGRALMGPSMESAAELIIDWLDTKPLRMVARDAVREARRSVAERPDRTSHERLLNLRSYPELAPLL